MVLSGTLREFILADVLQLLTQQKITGRLVINSGKLEGTILFKEGNVIGATRHTESFTNKLFYYLINVVQEPRNKVRELFSSYEGKSAELTSLLEKRGILSHQVLEEYATSVVIDIACSLFLWTSGSYHFDSIPNVDAMIPASINLPVENIVMEAMRRIDEWHRMKEAITEDTILVVTEKEPDFIDHSSPLENPVAYYYSQINGTQPVKALIEDSFQTEYKIYESLYSLLQSEHIQPLSESLSRTVHEALNRSSESKSSSPAFISALISVCVIIGILLFSSFFNNFLLKKLAISSALKRDEVTFSAAEHRTRVGYQFMKFNTLHENSVTETQNNNSHITRQDLTILARKQKLHKKSNRLGR